MASTAEALREGPRPSEPRLRVIDKIDGSGIYLFYPKATGAPRSVPRVGETILAKLRLKYSTAVFLGLGPEDRHGSANVVASPFWQEDYSHGFLYVANRKRGIFYFVTHDRSTDASTRDYFGIRRSGAFRVANGVTGEGSEETVERGSLTVKVSDSPIFSSLVAEGRIPWIGIITYVAEPVPGGVQSGVRAINSLAALQRYQIIEIAHGVKPK